MRLFSLDELSSGFIFANNKIYSKIFRGFIFVVDESRKASINARGPVYNSSSASHGTYSRGLLFRRKLMLWFLKEVRVLFLFFIGMYSLSRKLLS